MVIPGNLIIISHCRDEVIYFYDYIDKDSLLVFLSPPSNQKDKEILNNFITESGTRFIQLEEIEMFDSTFTLSSRTKSIIKDLIDNYKPSRVITQAKATIDSDIMSRRLYEYIQELNISTHYVPKYNINNNKLIPLGVQKYLKLYSNSNKVTLNTMISTYNTVDGIKKV
jgi:hypothetical protein